MRTISALACNLDVAVVAEGVEMPEQADLLAGENCQEMQGFLFSRPFPASDLQSFLLGYEPEQKSLSYEPSLP